ncbi:MAG TPA: fatty acid desaturase [Xanthomonadaceae bacterium]|jgi:stearoyl-CoA desaturase (delta-9 desaturase)
MTIPAPQAAFPHRILRGLTRWFDTASADDSDLRDGDRVDWIRVIPFLGLHLACLAVFAVGWSWFALWTALAMYCVRMLAITGFYHRYFSHKAFKTSRPVQFAFALLGAASVQRGPLWWAAHHRNHHRHSDTDRDLHSPVTRSFFWSHMGWFMSPRGFVTEHAAVPDLMKYPELRWLDRYDLLAPVAFAALLLESGHLLHDRVPALHTSGPQLLVWGFFVSTVVLFHCTVTINSLAHRWGSRRFATRDNSRNNWLLALITFGEGWHNNHHHFPGSARQGFRWWEYDLTWYVLRAMAAVGLVWDLKPVPAVLRGVRLESGGGVGSSTDPAVRSAE